MCTLLTLLVQPCTCLKCLFTCLFHPRDCKIPDGRNYILCLAPRRHAASGYRMNDGMNQSVRPSVNTDGNNESVDSNGGIENGKQWMDVKFRSETREK